MTRETTAGTCPIGREDLPGEEWRPIPGYEDCYEVSNLGRVYRKSDVQRPGRILKSTTIPLGYQVVRLTRNGQGKVRRVHVLMMLAFVGPKPEGMLIRHLDGDGRNSRLSNLAYGTASENQQDSVRHGTHVNIKKTCCKHGHEFTPENIYEQPSQPGSRRCRVCKARIAHEYEERKKARRAAA